MQNSACSDSHNCEQQLDFIAVNSAVLVDINLIYQRQRALIAPLILYILFRQGKSSPASKRGERADLLENVLKQRQHERGKFLKTQLLIAMIFAM